MKKLAFLIIYFTFIAAGVGYIKNRQSGPQVKFIAERALLSNHLLQPGDLSVQADGRQYVTRSVEAGELVTLGDIESVADGGSPATQVPDGAPVPTNELRPVPEDGASAQPGDAAAKSLLEEVDAKLAGFEKKLEAHVAVSLPIPPEIRAVVELQRAIDANKAGGATLDEVLALALDVSWNVIAATESKPAFIEQFPKEFIAASGGETGGGGAALQDVAGLMFEVVKNQTQEGSPMCNPDTLQVPVETRTVLFEAGAAEGPGLDNALNDIVEDWTEKIRGKDCQLGVSGHADTEGSDDDNHDVSERRAKAVALGLGTKLGLPTDAVIIESWGERRLAKWTPDGSVWPGNRRAEATLRCTERSGL